MMKDEAHQAGMMARRDKIVSLCQQLGVWFNVEETHNPSLSLIRMNITIKVPGQC